MSDQAKKGDASKKEVDKTGSDQLKGTSAGAGVPEIRGKVQLADTILESIAVMAVQEVEGVHAIETRLKDLIKDKRARGVEAEMTEEGVKLTLEITVQHGFRIIEVADTIRAKVAAAMDSMTGIRVMEVNIHVADIYFPEEKKPEVVPEVEEEPTKEEKKEEKEEEKPKAKKGKKKRVR